MCGINGLFSAELTAEERLRVIQKMNGCLSHRGPNSEGVWGEADVTLGHRRLSIIDLSAQGNQPFFSNDQRFAMVYNGELYNYRELRSELENSQAKSPHRPYSFRTSSDTEVVLAAYARWGENCLQHFNGMYAFAIYDRTSRELFAARDPLGVKPFYYTTSQDAFLFSSEVRPILKSGLRAFSLNDQVLAEYTMYQTVMAPETLVREIKMLMPGHWLRLRNGAVTISKYFDLCKELGSVDMSYQDACVRVGELLRASVERRMVADVPFGAFLSGGIDSSSVVALMSQVSASPIDTFNVSFDESEFSESPYARLVAKKFSTRHHEIKLTPNDFLEQLPEALTAMDHPSGDGPNTYIVSKATRAAGITMALSGIGGDELFAGYSVFKRMQRIEQNRWIGMTPRLLRTLVGSLIRKLKNGVPAEKVAELLSLPGVSFANAYPRVRTLFTHKQLTELVSGNPFRPYQELMLRLPQTDSNLLSRVSVAEMSTYLQNVLLRDTDQMSMAVALEVREPFLDKELVAFVLSLNDKLKYPHTPKKLLVDSMGGLLPAEVVNRPKMGFTFPWQRWLKQELFTFMDTQLAALNESGLYLPGAVKSLWNRFLNDDPRVSWSRVWHLAVLSHWMVDHDLV